MIARSRAPIWTRPRCAPAALAAGATPARMLVGYGLQADLLANLANDGEIAIATDTHNLIVRLQGRCFIFLPSNP